MAAANDAEVVLAVDAEVLLAVDDEVVLAVDDEVVLTMMGSSPQLLLVRGGYDDYADARQ